MGSTGSMDPQGLHVNLHVCTSTYYVHVSKNRVYDFNQISKEVCFSAPYALAHQEVRLHGSVNFPYSVRALFLVCSVSCHSLICLRITFDF